MSSHDVPLPRVPRGQSAKSCFDMPVTDPVTLGNGSRYIVHSQVHTIPDYYETTDVVTDKRIHMSVESFALR
jgi:hypothetical protein